MNQQNQTSKKIIGLVAAISGSMLFGLPAIAQNNPSMPYNGNGELRPNNDRQSPDRNNPGVNQSPENRLTPSNSNRMNNGGANQSPDNGMSPSDSSSGSQQPSDSTSGSQQYRNNSGSSPYNSNRNSINSSTGSSALNPCPSIFYEPKYRDTVGVPAGCPATNPGTSSTP